MAIHSRARRPSALLLRAVGIASNQHVFGLFDSGHMSGERVDRFLAALPDGVSELYCHPATRRWQGLDCLPDDYLCVEEFEALASTVRRERLEREGVKLIRFADLAMVQRRTDRR